MGSDGRRVSAVFMRIRNVGAGLSLTNDAEALRECERYFAESGGAKIPSLCRYLRMSFARVQPLMS